MRFVPRLFLIAPALLSTTFLLHANAFSKIEDRMRSLRSLSDTQRPIATVQLAAEIRALPPSQDKLKLADELAGFVTEGDQGQGTIQAVAVRCASRWPRRPFLKREVRPRLSA